MKLKDLKRSGASYSAVLADVAGNRDYELTITGNRALAERAFKEVEFEVTLDPKASPAEFEARSREFWARRVDAREPHPVPGAETIEAISKRARPVTAKNSVVVSLRRTSGTGTWWAAWFPGLFLPAGANLFFVLPRVWTCWGVVVPATGDADVFLSLGSPSAPPVSTAMAGGTTMEGVTFTGAPFPWTHFAAWFRVNGFLTSVTDFGMAGHSIP